MYIQTLLLLASSYSNRWCLLKRWNSPTMSWINMATWVQYLGLWIPWDEIEKSHKTSSKSLPPLALPLLPSVPESFHKNIMCSSGSQDCSCPEAIYRDAMCHFCARGLGAVITMDFLRRQQLLFYLYQLNQGHVHFGGYYSPFWG